MCQDLDAPRRHYSCPCQGTRETSAPIPGCRCQTLLFQGPRLPSRVYPHTFSRSRGHSPVACPAWLFVLFILPSARVCLCVCERERQGEREREQENNHENGGGWWAPRCLGKLRDRRVSPTPRLAPKTKTLRDLLRADSSSLLLPPSHPLPHPLLFAV